VTSIQRTERPGDARPPENRGHITDPPHPDPWKQKQNSLFGGRFDLSSGSYLSSLVHVNLEQRFSPTTYKSRGVTRAMPRRCCQQPRLLRRLQQTGDINFVILYIKCLSAACEHLCSLFRRVHCLLSAMSALLSSSLSRCTLLILTLSETYLISQPHFFSLSLIVSETKTK